MRKTIEWCMEHDDHVMLSEDDGSCEIEEYDLVPVGRSLADDPQAVRRVMAFAPVPKGAAVADPLRAEAWAVRVLRAAEGEHG